MSDELRYERVTSDMICESLKQYGPHARIAAPEDRRYTAWVARDEPIYEQPEPKVHNAADLAVERIRELEAQVKADREWLIEAARVACETLPSQRLPHYGVHDGGAWRRLCEHSREVHGRTISVIADRVNELEKADRERDPFGAGR